MEGVVGLQMEGVIGLQMEEKRKEEEEGRREVRNVGGGMGKEWKEGRGERG